MKQPRVALAAFLMVLAWHSAASAQRTRFVKAEEFDSGCIQAGQFVEVTYYAGNRKECHLKGHVKAIGDSSFTIAASLEEIEVSFHDLDILIIGRRKPDIILIKHTPTDTEENRARSAPGSVQNGRILA